MALRVNGAEALWYVGSYFSWGYDGTANYFADRVGIGTTTPSESLHVTGNIRANGSVMCGALLESNLQTAEERAAGRIDRFEQGDVLCWDDEKLELCSTANDRLVPAVADAQGRPIVLGAEPVKVLGKVTAGDYLVSSNQAGYAMAAAEPVFGIVIAQALEDFNGERGQIKAMIRKM